MRIWIDTEFNEFRGELISMALVAEDGQEFYEVLECDDPGPWVAQNVMPILGKNFIPLDEFWFNLAMFLQQYDSIHVIADWPEDIKHFCDSLITGPGLRLNTPPLTLEIRRDLDAVSALPHNALEDARSIMRRHLELEAEPVEA